MQLFLASQDLGEFANILQQMVGKRRRALVVSNARDYYNDETRIAGSVEKTLINLSKIGIEAERLDLRQYFGKQGELADLIEREQVGLVFSIGGNVICLATAMHTSGLDEIVRQGIAEDKFVYGGYSAGAMVTGNDLSLYDVKPKAGKEQPLHQVVDITRDTYNLEPYKYGLGLISQYIMPHMDRADHIDAMRERLANIEQADAEAIRLNDADVFVADGDTAQIMRGQKQ